MAVTIAPLLWQQTLNSDLVPQPNPALLLHLLLSVTKRVKLTSETNTAAETKGSSELHWKATAHIVKTAAQDIIKALHPHITALWLQVRGPERHKASQPQQA